MQGVASENRGEETLGEDVGVFLEGEELVVPLPQEVPLPHPEKEKGQ